MTLRLAPDLELADDLVTKTVGIVAQRRKGKTYTASVIAEEFVDAGIPWVALDPTGAWWGLRSSADGDGPGLPVFVLGGLHGDVPLDRSDGKAVARLVVEHPAWYVLDLSLFESRAAERDFAAEFGETLYRLKAQPGRGVPLHLFIDEADMFVPQEKETGDQRMLGAFQSIVRRGGIRGLGTTLISQRPALVNKSVLTQLDLLIMLRLVAGNDQDAVDKNYIRRAGTPEQRAALLDSMASLALGEAWLWEPGEALFDRVRIRERHTFNSSATPKLGEERVEPSALAEVDVAALKASMAETIARADAEDPAKLQRLVRERDARIRDLERELAARPDIEPERIEVTVEVPVAYVPDPILDVLRRARITAADLGALITDALAEVVDLPPIPAAPTPRPPIVPRPPAEREPAKPRPERPAAGGDTLSGPDRKVLTVLAQFPDGRNRRQLCAMAGYTWSGGFRNILSSLRSRALIVGGNQETMRITADGRRELGHYDALPRGRALLDWWLAKVSGPEARILAHLVDIYPTEIVGPDLAETLGYGWSGGFRNNLSSLRTAELIVGGNTTGMRASDELMEAIR